MNILGRKVRKSIETAFWLFFNAFLGAIAFVLGVNSSFFEVVLGMENIEAGFASLGLALIFTFLGAQIAVVTKLDRVEAQQLLSTEKLQEAIGIISDTKVFESPLAASKYISERLPLMSEVWNTAIRYGEEKLSVQDFYGPEIWKEWVDAPSRVIKNGGVWREIYSSNYDVTNHRTDRLPQARQPGQFFAYEVNGAFIPFTNFIILRYRSGGAERRPDEVLWGWAFDKNVPITKVFLSNRQEMVEYFLSQFDLMKKNATVTLPTKV